jgi:hypothetical protein
MPDIDASKPHIARIYDFWLGGRDNFAADRVAAKLAIAASPTVLPGVRANRRFLGRVVRYMAAAGIRQFLDIGTGIPTAGNTHLVAQSIDPRARVVYVDNDPIVLSHSMAMLKSTTMPPVYIHADARDTATILTKAAGTLDLTEPVGVLLIAILHCIQSEDDPYQLVKDLMAAVPYGSFLAISHPAPDQETEASHAQDSLTQSIGQPITFRTRDEVTRFFDGLYLLEPGVVPVEQWRTDSDLDLDSPPTAMWAALGKKD